MMKILRQVGIAFATAATLGANSGCSTTQQTNFNPEGCMTSQQFDAKLLLIFALKTSSADEFSKACHAGKIAAQTTLIGRQADGQLHPNAARIGLTFYKDIQDKIENGTETEKPSYTDVLKYFGYFLQKTGGITIEDIQKQVAADDKLREEAEERARNSYQPAPSPPAKVCKGHGPIFACN